MKYFRSLVLASLISVVAADVARGQSSGDELQAPVELSGLDLYREQYCGLCHTLARAGTAGIFGPPHDDIVSMAAERLADPRYAGKAATAAEYIRESILEPDVYVVPGFEGTVHRMPAYTHLSEEVVAAIVSFLVETPAPDSSFTSD